MKYTLETSDNHHAENGLLLTSKSGNLAGKIAVILLL